jgi:hypothetical protein
VLPAQRLADGGLFLALEFEIHDQELHQWLDVARATFRSLTLRKQRRPACALDLSGMEIAFKK